MTTLSGPNFRPLRYYAEQFPQRIEDPTVLDPALRYALISRVLNAPDQVGAHEHPVVLKSVNELSLGRYVINLVFVGTKEIHRSFVGEMYDGVWNSTTPLITGKVGRQFELCDGIIIDDNPTRPDQPEETVSLDVPHALELTGV